MKKAMLISSFIIVTLGLISGPYAAQVPLGPDLKKIPPYYKLASGTCLPGRGYTFSAEAPNYPSSYPKLILRVFNGEVIGFTFELEAKEGWRPWYDQPEGKPNAHEGGPPHYTQSIYIKKGPTAEECEVSKGPLVQ